MGQHDWLKLAGGRRSLFIRGLLGPLFIRLDNLANQFLVLNTLGIRTHEHNLSVLKNTLKRASTLLAMANRPAKRGPRLGQLPHRASRSASQLPGNTRNLR